MHDTLGWNVIGPDMLQAFADQLSQKAMDALVASYRSRAGRAFIAKSAKPQAGSLPLPGPAPLDPRVFTQDEIDGIEVVRRGPTMKAMEVAMPKIIELMAQIFSSQMGTAGQQFRQISGALDAANAAQATSAASR